MRDGVRLLLAALCLVCLALPSCDSIDTEKVYRNGTVVCADGAAADIGLQVLKDGGNAVDAACATALALAVTLPRAGNIGGGGFALAYRADSNEVTFLDFRETAPAGTQAQAYLDAQGLVDRDKATVGPLAAGVPGTVAGLVALHERFGMLPWARLVEPARFLADTGFVVDDGLAASLDEHADKLGRFESTAKVFMADGRLIAAGERLLQKDLAATLGRLESDGRDGFYAGETAEAIAAYCAANGGTITIDDLSRYRAIWRQPLRCTFRDVQVFMPGLPSSGGVVMGQILSFLDSFELEKYTPGSAQYLHLFTEAARRAYADREKYLGDPDFTVDYSAELLDADYLASRLKTIDPAHATPSADVMPGVASHRESDETTHLVVVDRDGNIVSLTYTLNTSYGSKAVVSGCGFLLNSEMDDFAIVPGQANEWGLVGGEVNRIEPGKRMLSSMTPTIVLSGKHPYMALGSPGGSKIITAVAQTIINYRVFKLAMSEAVTAPRFHHQWQPDVLFVERGGYEAVTLDPLTAMGHTVQERSAYGAVMGVGFSPDGLFVTGAADVRRPGAAVRGF